ncbi:MAG TPA: hypothetical protein VLN45_04270 [Ignavibacteriaceae bacterium]|nr:hypothetical protein [Ignavibacteriaceae bacterium]
MPYKIYPSEDSSYITLQVEGDFTAKDSMERNLEAHSIAKKLGINKFFVDVTNARNTDTIINNYQFAYEDMRKESGIDKNSIVAIVVSPEDHSHDFVETVAMNSGLNVRFFRDKEKALEYIKSKT